MTHEFGRNKVYMHIGYDKGASGSPTGAPYCEIPYNVSLTWFLENLDPSRKFSIYILCFKLSEEEL